jgi:hypothetical protein
MKRSKTNPTLTMALKGALALGGILLMVERLSKLKKSRASWPMLAMGAVGTVPLAMGVVKNVKEAKNAVA